MTQMKQTKLDTIIKLLKRDTGATITELAKATKWQAHSVRGAISGAIKRKLGLPIENIRDQKRGRVYRVASKA